MSIHINRFVDLVRATEARGQRDLHMSLKDARDLHADITRLLGTVEDLRKNSVQQATESVMTVELTGGGFRDS